MNIREVIAAKHNAELNILHILAALHQDTNLTPMSIELSHVHSTNMGNSRVALTLASVRIVMEVI